MTDTGTPTYIVGVDLGTRRDFTALAVLDRHLMPSGEARYDVTHLDRWRGRGYSDLPGTLSELVQALRQVGHQAQIDAGRYRSLEPNIHVVIDATGVGVSVIEEIRKYLDCIGVTIHGGDAVNHDRNDWRVSKKALVSKTQILLEQHRLMIAEDLDHTEILIQELDNFRSKKAILTGHDSFGAGEDWRQGNHDDLVLAVAMSAWYGEHCLLEDESDEVVDAMTNELAGLW